MKFTLFLDHIEKIVFWLYMQKIQHNGENNVFWDHIEKIAFWSIIGNLHYFEITLKKTFLGYICENINISAKTTFFEILLKKSFFCSYLRPKYQHLGVKLVFTDQKIVLYQ